jgi:hypothetical protein
MVRVVRAIRIGLLAIGMTSAVAGVARAGEAHPWSTKGGPAPKPATICETIDRSAAAHGLPVEFFARLIWRESRLQPNAVSSAGAQGIAQFMPQTAALRNLANAFDPAQAIPASAHYLDDLRDRFGNLGLAAAAYNSGEQRVSDWLAGSARLPRETQDYVVFITGRTAEDWRSVEPEVITASSPAARSKCDEIVAVLAKPGAGSAPVVAAAATGSAKASPWGVQVAGNFSEAKARTSYASLQRQFAAILAPREPLVLRSVMRSRGTAPYYDVRVPAETRAEADALCARLHAAGGACVVMKN